MCYLLIVRRPWRASLLEVDDCSGEKVGSRRYKSSEQRVHCRSSPVLKTLKLKLKSF